MSSYESSTGRGASHAKKDGDASIVPQSLQETLPNKAEQAVPNTIHDTGKTGSRSHAKEGGSILPETIQNIVPEKVERLVPNAIHDTGNAKVSDPPSDPKLSDQK